MSLQKVLQNVVRVTQIDNGLGVVVGNYIFTAAHCLEFPAQDQLALGSYSPQKCQTLDGQPFFAEIAFTDLVSDFAVLRCPDSQGLPKECLDYLRALQLFEGINISQDNVNPQPVYLLNANLAWIKGHLSFPSCGRAWVDIESQVHGGASGGPIVTSKFELICITSNFSEEKETCDGLQPIVKESLPSWLSSELQS